MALCRPILAPGGLRSAFRRGGGGGWQSVFGFNSCETRISLSLPFLAHQSHRRHKAREGLKRGVISKRALSSYLGPGIPFSC